MASNFDKWFNDNPKTVKISHCDDFEKNEESNIILANCDTLDFLGTIKAPIATLIVTSPPYHLGQISLANIFIVIWIPIESRIVAVQQVQRGSFG